MGNVEMVSVIGSNSTELPYFHWLRSFPVLPIEF